MCFVLGNKGLSSFAKVGVLVLLALLVILFRSNRRETDSKETAGKAFGPSDTAVKFAALAITDDLKKVASGDKGVINLSSQDFLDWTAIDRRVTAKEYEAAYEASEIAADNEYKDKKILVTGTLAGVEKDFTGRGFLDLAGANMFLPGVHAQLTSESMDEAATMKKGQHLSLVCTGAGRVVTIALLNECQSLTDYVHAQTGAVGARVNEALAGRTALPTTSAKVVGLSYAMGLLIPANSACLNNDVTACGAEIDALKKDPAKEQAIVNKFKEIETKIRVVQ